MADAPLKINCFRYETTRALFDGTVTIDDVEAEMHTAPTLPEIFEPMLRRNEFDVSELGLTFYLRTLDHNSGSSFIALPIFPNRVFRHSCVFVNSSSGITSPADLAGKTIGEFGIYGQDSGVWAKGILMDEYGFRPEQSRWIIGGLDRSMPPFDFVAHPRPADVDIAVAADDQALGPMLESGEIDALFSANVPQCFLDGSPHVARLFPDFEPVERDYFQRTGIFPMMHTVVITRELLDARPELGHGVYRAFLRAKDVAAEQYRQARRLYEVTSMVPWMNTLFERNRELFADDWWPYGVSQNRTALDTYLRYHFEQSLSARQWTVEEIFAPGLLST
jgi:4,5-dihydroxyphthalate decarboxylase